MAQRRFAVWWKKTLSEWLFTTGTEDRNESVLTGLAKPVSWTGLNQSNEAGQLDRFKPIILASNAGPVCSGHLDRSFDVRKNLFKFQSFYFLVNRKAEGTG